MSSIVVKRGESVSFTLKGKVETGIVISGKTASRSGKVAVRNVSTNFACLVPVKNILHKFNAVG